jgi:ATP-dependent DNA helicase RecG
MIIDVTPITDDKLQAVAKDTESDRVERKATLSDRDRIAEAICAFANDLPGYGLPGYVLVGVDDSGRPTGLQVDDSLLLKLGSLRDDGNVLPLPSMVVSKRLVDGVEIAVVEVMPSSAPPVRFRGRPWVRIGPKRGLATAEEEARLAERRRASDLPFDARPLSSASLDDLDLDLFERTYLRSAVAPEILEANERSVEHQLSALRFASPDGLPTVAGVIAVGREPASFVPGAFIQFLRIDGTEIADPLITERRLELPLPELLRDLDELLRVNIRTAVDLTSSVVEERRSDYPVAALQQLTRNALMHRTYEASTAPVRITWFLDRVEIQNPGGPYGQVTVENFGKIGLTDYRNPTVAEAMRQLGYVQRFGVGIATARRALAENGNPALFFEVEPTYVSATVRQI